MTLVDSFTYDISKVAMFTGHRPQHLGGFEEDAPLNIAVRKALRKEIEQAVDIECFISGGALGVDQWAAEIVLELGKLLVIARPFPSQHVKWPLHARNRYCGILSRAHRIIDVSSDPYHPSKMHLRNKWMIDRSSRIIAVYRPGTAGGTASALEMAKSHAVSVINPDILSL